MVNRNITAYSQTATQFKRIAALENIVKTFEKTSVSKVNSCLTGLQFVVLLKKDSIANAFRRILQRF